MLAVVRDFERAAGRKVGVKVASGIRTARDAIRYLGLVNENLPARPARREEYGSPLAGRADSVS